MFVYSVAYLIFLIYSLAIIKEQDVLLTRIPFLMYRFMPGFSFIIIFALPFILLLVMNCVIIFKLHERSKSSVATSRTQDKAQNNKIKNSDKQVYIMLLLVTFAYLILVTPMTTYSTLYSSVIAPRIKSSKMFAGIYLYYHIGHKLNSTNNGINFFLYVMSG